MTARIMGGAIRPVEARESAGRAALRHISVAFVHDARLDSRGERHAASSRETTARRPHAAMAEGARCGLRLAAGRPGHCGDPGCSCPRRRSGCAGRPLGRNGHRGTRPGRPHPATTRCCWRARASGRSATRSSRRSRSSAVTRRWRRRPAMDRHERELVLELSHCVMPSWVPGATEVSTPPHTRACGVRCPQRDARYACREGVAAYRQRHYPPGRAGEHASACVSGGELRGLRLSQLSLGRLPRYRDCQGADGMSCSARRGATARQAAYSG